jgi:hypothetical protein
MKKSRLKFAATAIMALAATAMSIAQPICSSCGPLSGRPVVNLSTLSDADGNLTATNTVLNCSNVYKLDKRIYVIDGRTLTIPAGTIIKADPATVPADVKALIVCQGAKIFAEGNETCPVIFTSTADPLNGTKPLCERMEWGGLIILGKAVNNVRSGDTHPSGDPVAYADYVGYIEGLPVPDVRHHYGQYPSTAAAGSRQFYNDDNSGVLRYVSIRFGGSIIGAANEINGLTMGSVGSGTVIDHVEVVSTQDDAFEFFGGTVNVKHLIAIGTGDDSFDWDQQYEGKGQFLYSAYLPGTLVASQGSHGVEIDGNDVNGRTPVSTGQFYNVTVIGNSATGNIGIEAKAETKGAIVNSIFANFANAGLRVASGATQTNYTNNEFVVKCNTFVNVPEAVRAMPISNQAKFDADGNVALASLSGFDAMWDFTGTCPNPTFTGKLDQVPDLSAVTTTCEKPIDGFWNYAPYRGAFEPGVDPWTKGWTYYASVGIGQQDINCPTDLNGDGITNTTDYLQVVNAFGRSCQ